MCYTLTDHVRMPCISFIYIYTYIHIYTCTYKCIYLCIKMLCTYPIYMYVQRYPCIYLNMYKYVRMDKCWLQGWLINKGAIYTGTPPLFWNFISLFERPRTRLAGKMWSQNFYIQISSCKHASIIHVCECAYIHTICIFIFLILIFISCIYALTLQHCWRSSSLKTAKNVICMYTCTYAYIHTFKHK